jgi:hypothetical protein
MIWLVLLFVSQVLGIDVTPLAQLLSQIFQITGAQ